MRSSSAPAITAWSPPATWRAPVSRCWCSSAIAYIGGAAVSRRLYQDFTYSNCSYVCSLLRPEIMRTLELPKYRAADHPVRRRLHDDARRRSPGAVRQPRRVAPRDRPPLEARRGSLRSLFARRDAPVQVHQAAADARAARPDLVQAARHRGVAVPRPAVSRTGRGAHVRHAALLDHERGRFPRRVLRERDRQGAFRRQLHHRHGARAALAGHGLRAAAPLHGRYRRHRRRLGLRARRHGRDQQRARRPRCSASGGTIRSAAPVARILGQAAAAPAGSCSRTARRSKRGW